MKTNFVEIRVRGFYAGTGPDEGVNATPAVTAVMERSRVVELLPGLTETVEFTEKVISNLSLKMQPMSEKEVIDFRKEEEDES